MTLVSVPGPSRPGAAQDCANASEASPTAIEAASIAPAAALRFTNIIKGIPET